MSRDGFWDTTVILDPRCLLLAVSVALPFVKHQLNASVCSPKY